MRTWVKVTLGGVALIVAAVMALAGTGAYFVLRDMDKRTAAEAEATQACDAVKARFGPRPPLVEIVDPRRADVRINRPSEPSAAQVSTVHVVSWKRDTGELMRTQIPLWLMRFSSVNIASQLGIAPVSLRLTVADIQRYGPGILADYTSPGVRVLVWVD